MSQPKRIHWLIAILMAVASFLIGMTVQQYFCKKNVLDEEEYVKVLENTVRKYIEESVHNGVGLEDD